MEKNENKVKFIDSKYITEEEKNRKCAINLSKILWILSTILGLVIPLSMGHFEYVKTKKNLINNHTEIWKIEQYSLHVFGKYMAISSFIVLMAFVYILLMQEKVLKLNSEEKIISPICIKLYLLSIMSSFTLVLIVISGKF